MTMLFLLLICGCTKMNFNSSLSKGVDIKCVNGINDIVQGDWNKKKVQEAKVLMCQYRNEEAIQYIIFRLSKKQIPDVDLDSITKKAFANNLRNVNWHVTKEEIHISFWLADRKQYYTLGTLADRGMSLDEVRLVEGKPVSLLGSLIQSKAWQTALAVIHHQQKGNEDWNTTLDLMQKYKEEEAIKYRQLLFIISDKLLKANLHK